MQVVFYMNKRIWGILLGTAVVVSIPLIAMQFTSEVDWDVRDFVAIGILLLGTGFLFELVMRKVSDTSQRVLLALALLAAMLFIWADLAVGIFNIPGISGS